ncbi:FliM/FliN family flagellar motor switch protein [Parachitinimonas caeni]|uniref:Flagellar motor switch protein FliN n=1 Tax=Parachitinimonas caeni TaxID=3031301 RepID=A0ABT7DYJ6_9NEIS|nr:FliM/FliN family flagellar motor switch protein [Parachitinimonas caeni]MDK2125132.1 FliM/FliN family flagellar motor switch protein [Parachitinimonas caeni]
MSSQNNTSATEQNAPQLVELPELKSHPTKTSAVANGMDVIRSVKVRLSVRLGETDISVGELLDMKEDSVLKLDRLVDESVDILLDGNVIARGQLVAIGDSFGVQITEKPNMGKH